MEDLDPFGEIPGFKKIDNQELSDPFLQGNIQDLLNFDK